MISIWKWPDGLIWKLTKAPTVRSRRRKFNLFLREMKPSAHTTVLDVGATSVASGQRGENFLEEWYANPEMITALVMGDVSAFHKHYPKMRVVTGDGLNMPFQDKEFDIVFSNAVIEHVGDRQAQKQFVAECLRVGKRVFITTPSRNFPLESHTMIPFAHWLPEALRNLVYRSLGRKNEGTHGYLTLLTARSLRALFPDDVSVKIVRQKIVGMTSVLIAIV
ncbi:MAG: methyltransferase domain-containing protein [Patescibacteria group bacterium]